MWLPRYHRPSASNLQNAKLINPKVHAFASRMHGYHLEVPLIKARVIYIITFSEILYNVLKCSSQKVSSTMYLVPSRMSNPKTAQRAPSHLHPKCTGTNIRGAIANSNNDKTKDPKCLGSAAKNQTRKFMHPYHSGARHLRKQMTPPSTAPRG